MFERARLAELVNMEKLDNQPLEAVYMTTILRERVWKRGEEKEVQRQVGELDTAILGYLKAVGVAD